MTFHIMRIAGGRERLFQSELTAKQVDGLNVSEFLKKQWDWWMTGENRFNHKIITGEVFDDMVLRQLKQMGFTPVDFQWHG